MVALNINVLTEDQLRVLAVSLVHIIKGMDSHPHIQHEYKIALDDVETLYLKKSRTGIMISNCELLIQPKSNKSQADIIEHLMNN